MISEDAYYMQSQLGKFAGIDRGHSVQLRAAADSSRKCVLWSGLDNRRIFLVFRGTKGWANTLTDLNIHLVELGGGGRVHEGFLSYYNSLESRIVGRINLLQINLKN